MTAYRIFFGINGLGFLVLAKVTKSLKDDREKQTAKGMGIAMYRTARTLFGRAR